MWQAAVHPVHHTRKPRQLVKVYRKATATPHAVLHRQSWVRPVCGAPSLLPHSQQESDVTLTRDPLTARGFSSASLASLLMPSPQGVQLAALGSEYNTQPSLKKPLSQGAMEPPDRE